MGHCAEGKGKEIASLGRLLLLIVQFLMISSRWSRYHQLPGRAKDMTKFGKLYDNLQPDRGLTDVGRNQNSRQVHAMPLWELTVSPK